MTQWSMSFEPQALSEIARFYGFGVYLSAEVQTALKQGGGTLVDAAVANTWSTFKNPSGKLAGTIGLLVDSPFEVQAAVGSLYGHRREYSFKGPDSLGRYFPNDPAAYYLTHAMNDNQQAVLIDVETAAERALGRLVSG